MSLLVFSPCATRLQFPAKKHHLLVQRARPGLHWVPSNRKKLLQCTELVFQLSVTNFDADCIFVMHLGAATWMHRAASHHAKDASP